MLEAHPELRRERCLVRPGITGLWQGRGRSDNTTALGMAEHDLAYVREHGLAMDLRILAQTPLVVVRARGAF